MDIEEIIERLLNIQKDHNNGSYDHPFSDEDNRAIREAVFQLRLHTPVESPNTNDYSKNLREYAATHVGCKIYINFDCSDITVCGSEKDYFENVARLEKEFKNGIFTIIDTTSIQSDDNPDLLLDVGHNFISDFYERDKEAEK